MTIAEVLNTAADDIERRGWFNGRDSSKWEGGFVGPTCAAVAIEQAGRTEPGYDELRSAEAREAYHYFRKFLGLAWTGGALMQWNDRQPSAEIVIEKLREAAKAAEVERV